MLLINLTGLQLYTKHCRGKVRFIIKFSLPFYTHPYYCNSWKDYLKTFAVIKTYRCCLFTQCVGFNVAETSAIDLCCLRKNTRVSHVQFLNSFYLPAHVLVILSTRLFLRELCLRLRFIRFTLWHRLTFNEI